MSHLADHIARLLERADGCSVHELAAIHYEVMQADEHTDRLVADDAALRDTRPAITAEMARAFLHVRGSNRRFAPDGYIDLHDACVNALVALAREVPR